MSKSSLKKRLFRLLDRKTLAISTKARSVLHEHDHTFGRVRVTTDISSVFGPNTVDPPAAAIIVHILKLHYIQDQQHKDFF
jgi:hypothetical protein